MRRAERASLNAEVHKVSSSSFHLDRPTDEPYLSESSAKLLCEDFKFVIVEDSSGAQFLGRLTDTNRQTTKFAIYGRIIRSATPPVSTSSATGAGAPTPKQQS
jgi:hypothetical protein